MSYLSAKFQVCWFIHSKVLAIFEKNSFRDPIRPLVQNLENPGARVKYFYMLNPPAKFQVSRFIHSKVLAISKKNNFQDPIRPLVQILENIGTRVKYF